MSDTDLCYLSGQQAIRRFSQRQLSPFELMQALIERSEVVEPHINAFTEPYFEEALEQARAAEKRYRQGSQRPLEGIPLAVKDEFRLAGKRRSFDDQRVFSAALAYEQAFTAPAYQLDPRMTSGDTTC